MTCFIASWANSAVPVLRFTAFVFPFSLPPRPPTAVGPFPLYSFPSFSILLSAAVPFHAACLPSPRIPLGPRSTRVPGAPPSRIAFHGFGAVRVFLAAFERRTFLRGLAIPPRARFRESTAGSVLGGLERPRVSSTLDETRTRIPRDLRFDFDPIHRPVLSQSPTLLYARRSRVISRAAISLFLPPSFPRKVDGSTSSSADFIDEISTLPRPPPHPSRLTESHRFGTSA